MNIFVNGSFVTDKLRPKDIDGYFECSEDDVATGRLEQELNLLDPFKVWTWDPASRLPAPGSTKPQGELPMWRRYHVELYPHWGRGPVAQRDKHGHELTFPSFFRQCREEEEFKPKGIVKLVKESGR
jgi:hypothetical protein